MTGPPSGAAGILSTRESRRGWGPGPGTPVSTQIWQSVQMTDLAGRPGAAHPLASLPRVWWFPQISGFFGECPTYVRHALDDQPRVPNLDDRLSWLEAEAEKPTWSIDRGDDRQQTRALTPAGLEIVSKGLPLPSSLLFFARHHELQRRVRSATACYLDLADFPALTSAEGGGYLIHLLSDQQWCRHWMLYLDIAGNEAVVTSTEPIGFDLPDDYPALPPVLPISSATLNLEVCADSFVEFLYRFWIENEISFALGESPPFTAEIASYAARLARQASGP
jgi:hypothetical protein